MSVDERVEPQLPADPLPPVSVIMPVHNGERYVAEAIESILAQTHRHFEFIIIDDGSTDHTHEILASYAAQDDRIRVLSQPNQGQPVTLNRALNLARHEWVAIIDHDDLSLPHRLKTQLHAVIANPTAQAIASYAVRIDEHGARRGLVVNGPTTVAECRARAVANKPIGLVHPSVLMHRETVLAIGGYDPAFGPAADTELWSRLTDRHDVLALTEPLVCYRIHGRSMSDTRFFEQQCAVRWCYARQRARRQGLPEPSLAEFLAARRGPLGFGSLNDRRNDWAKLYGRRARLAQQSGLPARGMAWLLGAALLDSWHVVHRLRHDHKARHLDDL